MKEVIDTLKVDIIEFTNKCKSLSIHSTEYHYWNGCRCQAEVTLKQLESLKPKVKSVETYTNVFEKLEYLYTLHNIKNDNTVCKLANIDMGNFSRAKKKGKLTSGMKIKLANVLNVDARELDI